MSASPNSSTFLNDFSNLMSELVSAGSRIIIGDSPGRQGRPGFIEELERLMCREVMFDNVKGRKVGGYRNELICGESSESVGDGDLEIAVFDLMGNSILRKLKECGIQGNVQYHKPAFTSEELKEYAGNLGRHTKNLFVKSKKGEMFLIVARDDAEVKFKELGKVRSSTRYGI